MASSLIRKNIHPREYHFGRDYGYIEAYSGNQDNKSGHGSDYKDDYNTEDSYEYKEELDDDFRSGGVSSEVSAKSTYLNLTLFLLEMPLWQKRR